MHVSQSRWLHQDEVHVLTLGGSAWREVASPAMAEVYINSFCAGVVVMVDGWDVLVHLARRPGDGAGSQGRAARVLPGAG